MKLLAAIVALFMLPCLAAAQLFNPIVTKTFESAFTSTPTPFFAQTPAINYDFGGQGIAYNVPSPGCIGAACAAGSTSYRADPVNFKTSTFGTGFPYQLGFSASPDSYCYTISITQPGPYIVTLWLADTSAGGSWNVVIDGQKVGTVSTPVTGSFTTFAAANSGSFNATLGTHIMCLAWATGDSSFAGSGDFVAWQGGQAATGLACAAGPSYSGVIPAAAIAAFGQSPTCVANIDFTVPGGYFATLSNWLDVCNATGPVVFYAIPSSLRGTTPTCNQFNIINDGGTQVLDETWTGAGGNETAAFQTVNGNGSAGISVRGSYYVTATYRNTAASYTNLPSACTNPLPGQGPNCPFVTEFWQFGNCSGGGNACVFENDVDERYSYPGVFGDTCGAVSCGSGSTYHNWTQPPNDGSDARGFATFSGSGGVNNGYDATTYQTVSYRVTMDGVSNTGAASCAYLTGGRTYSTCIQIDAGAVAASTAKEFFIVSTGPQGAAHPNTTMDTYWQRIVIFSCPTYATTGCFNNPVLTTP